MTDVLKHRFTSPKLDGADTQQVQPSHWNDGHKFQGGNEGEVLTRDPTDLSFGAKWTPITIPPAVQEVPGGGINNDVLTRDLTVPVFGSKWAAPALTQTILMTTTGTVHDWVIPGLGSKNTLIDWAGASPLAVTGIAGGVNGQLLTIRNRSGNLLTFAHYNAGSAEQNKFINMAGSAPTPLGVYGVAQYIYFNSFWQLIGHQQNGWITPPYSAAAYYGYSTMVWTVEAGDVTECGYFLSGRLMTFSFRLNTTAISGSPTNALYMNKALFGGFSIARLASYATGFFSNAGSTAKQTRIQAYANDVTILTLDGSPMTVGVVDTISTLSFEVN